MNQNSLNLGNSSTNQSASKLVLPKINIAIRYPDSLKRKKEIDESSLSYQTESIKSARIRRHGAHGAPKLETAGYTPAPSTSRSKPGVLIYHLESAEDENPF